MGNKADRIALQIQKKIERRDYDSKIPAEPYLAEMFSTSLITIRQSLDLLEKQGMIYRIRRVGTFVKRSGKAKVRVGVLSFATFSGMMDEIKTALGKKFIGFDVEFFTLDSSKYKPEWEADLLIITSGGLLDFREFAQPFSRETMEKYLNDDFIRAPFETYRTHDTLYALPILFSPTLLRYRPEFAPVLDGCMMPGGFSREKAAAIASLAEKNGMPVWGFSEIFSCLWSSMFSGNGEKSAASLDLARTRNALKQFQPMLIPDMVTLANDEKSPGLLHRHLRQYCGDYSDYRVVSNPWGSNSISGEFIMMPRAGAHTGEALQLAEFMLSAEIQTIIGKHNAGIPVLKSAAWNSLSGMAPFNDLFFHNISGMVTNNAMEYDFMLRCKELLLMMLKKEISVDRMFDSIEHEIIMGKRRQKSVTQRLLFV